ncbi:MAG: 3-oxoacyl-[acyl-carrier-protein] reductase [Eggerthellaceae bacterium]|jgi:3-oxoacyl-[acyl-carrier protein] reductase|nr:3-oxoacyl-[acyl-carrier-protein] reductase [Eggerthellaceae bacterium]MCH4221515.1 3-oxoacyl-[acyl-carrier-protein] reductase [Eggerthellaceae bacterium]
MADKHALVTGGSRGIGRAICLRLASDGIDVAVNCVAGVDAAEKTAAACRERGVEAIVVKGDVSDAEQAKNIVADTVEAWGSIDILVNNAGIVRDDIAIRMSEEDFDAVIATNLRGSFLCMREAGRYMLRQRSGRIVNISSIVGLNGNAGQINYAASKAGVIGMTKTLALELGKRGITVNAVAPGFIKTDMTACLPEKVVTKMNSDIPLKRFGDPEDVAAAVAFLVSDDASYITGQVLSVNGGLDM